MTEHVHACPTCGQSVPSLGERLLACRTAPNWTRADVAARIGVTPSRLMLWEDDKALPSPADVEALAAIYDRTMAYFAVTPNEPH